MSEKIDIPSSTNDTITQTSQPLPSPEGFPSFLAYKNSLPQTNQWRNENLPIDNPKEIKELLLEHKEITSEILVKLQEALMKRVEWDSNLPSLIADLKVWDRARFSKSDQSVTILNPQWGLKLKIVFADEPKQRKTLSGTPFARGESIGDFISRRWPTRFEKDSCGASVWALLNEYGFKALLPQAGRDGNKWDTILETPPISQYFEKVPCDLPRDAQPWDVCVYNEWATLWKWLRKTKGHVEIKWNDNRFYSYYASEMPGGSSKTRETDPQKYQKLTGFTGYVYRLKNLG